MQVARRIAGFALILALSTAVGCGGGEPEPNPEVTPEIMDALQTPSPGNEGSADGEQVARPTKLIRIASMVRA